MPAALTIADTKVRHFADNQRTFFQRYEQGYQHTWFFRKKVVFLLLIYASTYSSHMAVIWQIVSMHGQAVHRPRRTR